MEKEKKSGAWTPESLRKLLDEYVGPATKEAAYRLMADHLRIYHSEGKGVTVTVAGVELLIKERKA